MRQFETCKNLSRGEQRHNTRPCRISIAIGLFLALRSFASAQDYKVAFVASHTAPGIYVMNADGRDVKRLTDDKTALLTDRAWSPDGQRILFFAIRSGDADLGKQYNLPYHFPLYVMDSDGANQRRLLDFPVLIDAVWSPDAKRILFTSSHEDPNRNDPDVQKNRKPALSALYVVDVATGALERVTELAHNDSGSWSPNGNQVVFCSARPKREIYVMNADGSNEKRLTNRGGGVSAPEWSPDGQSIAFVAKRTSVNHEAGWCILTTHPSKQTCVSRIAVNKVAWAPESTRVLVSAEGAFGVCDPDGSHCASPASGLDLLLWEPMFSPDGRKVIFRTRETTFTGIALNRTAKIYAVNIDGRDLRTLNGALGENTMFAVSPLLHKANE